MAIRFIQYLKSDYIPLRLNTPGQVLLYFFRTLTSGRYWWVAYGHSTSSLVSVRINLEKLCSTLMVQDTLPLAGPQSRRVSIYYIVFSTVIQVRISYSSIQLYKLYSTSRSVIT